MEYFGFRIYSDIDGMESNPKGYELQIVSNSKFCIDNDCVTSRWHNIYEDTRVRYIDNPNYFIFEIENDCQLIWYKDLYPYKIEYKIYSATPYRVKYWILHTFLPLVYELFLDSLVLHASSIEIDGKAVSIVAPSMGGKSTLAYYAVDKRRAGLICDESTVLRFESGVLVTPTHPYIRYFRKRFHLGKKVDNFVQGSIELDSIIVLQKGENRISISKLKGIEAFKRLLDATLIDMGRLEKNRFEKLLRVYKNIDIYLLKFPDNIDLISDIFDTILHIRKK